MLRQFTLALWLIIASLVQAQDTLTVRTLTFDSITTRRGWFPFPDTSHHFRKVLMHHTLKCSPLTSWDQYDCGEWDYLTYHFIHEHTGVLDSAALQHPYFLVGTAAPDSVRVSEAGHPLNGHQRWELHASVQQATNVAEATVGSNDTTDVNTLAGYMRRCQFLYTAQELTDAGLFPGSIDLLRFHPLAPEGAAMPRLTLRMRNTMTGSLTRFEEVGLTTVYDAQLSLNGTELVLSTPFIWDGISNILLDVAEEGWDDSYPAVLEASHAPTGQALQEIGFDDAIETNDDFVGVDAAALADISNAVTITFRAFGAPQLPLNTTLLEAVNAQGQRVLNIHLPWSDNNVYWDAGNDGSGYDRINKAAQTANVEGQWNDWAFVKNASTGSMKIYLNGVLWHSGTGKVKPMSGIVRMRVASDANGGNPYPGMIDGLNIFNTEVSATTIAAWHDRKTTEAHPDHAALLYSLEMDEGVYPGIPWLNNAVNGAAGAWLMGTVQRIQRPATALFRNPQDVGVRPVLTFVQGDHVIAIDSIINDFPYTDFTPHLSREIFGVQGNTTVPVDTAFGYVTGWTRTYDPSGNVIDSLYNDGTLYENNTLNYFGVPYEVVNDHEIGRYITPYGIGLSLGPNGFRWTYDVTDYQWLLHDSVELSAGNTQELIDLSFEMIEGDPPRDVVNVQRPWGPMASYSYASLSDDSQLAPVEVTLSPEAHEWRLMSRLTGHGDATSIPNVQGCCEFKDNTHYIYANGQQVDDWHIWRTHDCATNPVFPQGGTWIYGREGWCPGDVVRDHATELTPYVNDGHITLDYRISPVPLNNPGMGGGNYVVNEDLFEYTAPSHAFDAEIYNVKRPNNEGLYSRENPICYDPLVTVRNNGTTDITSLTFTYRVSGGQPEYHTWTGTLPHMEMTDITLPISSGAFWTGDEQHLFHVELIGVNGGDIDSYDANDRYTTHFDLPTVYPSTIVLYYKTNNRPEENSLFVRDALGNVRFSRTAHTAGTTYRDTLDFEPGCYTVEFLDTGDDGLKFWADPGAGSGWFRFRNLSNQILRTFEPEFGSSIKASFAMENIVSVPEVTRMPVVTVFPNPGQDQVTVRMESASGDARIQLFDAAGREVLAQATVLDAHGRCTLDLRGYDNGMYTVRLITEQGVSSAHLLKQ